MSTNTQVSKPLRELQAKRVAKLLPNGRPRWIRCYDNGGKTFDRYTVVFTGRQGGGRSGRGMSAHPTHPQGFGQWFDYDRAQLGRGQHAVDRPAYAHLGKRITFEDLPEDCRALILRDYREMWNLPVDAPAPSIEEEVRAPW